jgi:type II secretory pathway pseudopilin PulG
MAPDARTPGSDAGIGLLEVVISMLLFAVLAMAILPLAMQATRLSATNRDAVGANSFASGQLAAVRSRFPDAAANSCDAVRDAADTAVPDTAGTGLVADIAVAACPPTYPAAVTLTVVIRDPDASSPAAPLVTMASKIVVTSP